MINPHQLAAVSIGLIAVERAMPADGALCLCRWVDQSGEFEEITIARYAAYDGWDSVNGRITHWAEIHTAAPAFVVLSGIGPARLGSHVGYMIGAEGHIDA